MKKLLLTAVMAIASIGLISADDFTRDVNVLPAQAQQFLTQYFKARVSHIKVDKTLGRVNDYEVVLSDATEIDFGHDGSWDKIEMPRGQAVPSAIIPKAITDYVAKNYSGQKITAIDKERNSYEIELQNGIDLVFDRSGNFKRIDD